MLMRTPEPPRPRGPARLIGIVSRLFSPRTRPVFHGSVDELSDRLRRDVGAPPRLPSRFDPRGEG
jgi:hypothetical protein